MTSELLPATFYHRHSLDVARDLLGMVVMRYLPDGTMLSGRIVETEAYTPDDPSCHAHRGASERARSMFKAGGIAYVYLIYGMYYCFNAVTQGLDEGAAVLIRAIEPLSGIEAMQDVRGTTKVRDLARGPGRMCQALSINRTLDGVTLHDATSPLQIAHGTPYTDADIVQTLRIGIGGGDHAKLAPWRLIVRDNLWVSGSRRDNQGAVYDPQYDWFKMRLEAEG